MALAMAVVAAPGAARADDAGGCATGPIATVNLTGCQTTACPTPADEARFLSLAELAPGKQLDDRSIAQLHARFAATGLFRESSLRCAAGPDGLAVELHVEPHRLVRKVRIEGNQYEKRVDLLKRVFLRSGTVLDADPAHPELSEPVLRQIASLQRLYAGDGLEGVKIEVELEAIGDGAVDVTIRVAEGERQRIERVLLTHQHTGAPDADGQRCPTITQRRLERLAEVEYGDVQTTNLRRQVRERLRRAFQAVGFVRPSFEGGRPDDAAANIFRETIVTERCWLIRVWVRDDADADDAAEPAFRAPDPADPPRGGEAAERGREKPFVQAPLEDWVDVLPFGESGTFDREEAARGVDAITAVLRARGYAFADVALQYRELSPLRERQSSDVRGVIDYEITLNHERRIASIALPGAKAVEPGTLLELIDTKPYDFFGAPGFFELERAMADLGAIARYYQERGFFDFAFELTGAPDDVVPLKVLELANDDWIVWRYTFRDRGFRLKKRRGEASLRLEIPLHEGPQSRVAELVPVGATIADKAKIAALTGLGTGAPYGTHYLEEGIGKLTAWYRARGYHLVKIEPFCEAEDPRSGDPSFCDPRLPVRAQHVTLGLRVTEGRQVFVGEHFWRGNFETDPHALTRDLPQAGEPLDEARLNEAMRQMRALGLFNSVRIDIIGLDEDPPRDRVALVVGVEEADHSFLDLAAGVRSIKRQNLDRVPGWAASASGHLISNIDRTQTGFGRALPLDIPDVLFLLELEYLDLNVWGLGHQLRLPVSAGLSFSSFLRLASFDPTYVWPRLADTNLQLEARVIAELDRVTDPLDRLELGGELDFSLPISRGMLAGLTLRGGVIQLRAPSEPCLFCLEAPEVGFGPGLGQGLGEELAQEAICSEADDASAAACSDDAFRPQFTVALRWRWQTQDNPLHPTRGFALAARTSFILDRDRDSSTVVFNNFLKWELSGQLDFNLLGTVLAFFVRYGGSSTFGEAFLPANERFTLGGSNGLRGFADNAVCRYDRDGELAAGCPDEFGGNVVVNGSAELRVPLLSRLGFWAAFFVDAGALAKDHESLYAQSFRTAAGLGFRWLIGQQFPVRLDVGFPLERRCLTPRDEAGKCTLEEARTVHLDFLYPF